MLAPLILAATNPAEQIALEFNFNKQLFSMHFVGFAIVAFALHRWAYTPILKMLDERRNRIAESMANADKIKAELSRAEAKAQEIVRQAGAQANKIIEEARAAALAVGEQERQKAVADAQNILAKAREAGDAELARLKGELRKEFGRLVVEAAARTTGDLLTPDQKGRIADESIRQLSA